MQRNLDKIAGRFVDAFRDTVLVYANYTVSQILGSSCDCCFSRRG
jgi:hypothetical protein